MEKVSVIWDDGEGGRFDECINESRRNNIKDYGDVEFVIKPNATVNGRSAAMITFTVNIKGKRKRVQSVLTLAQLTNVAGVLKARLEFEEEQKGTKH